MPTTTQLQPQNQSNQIAVSGGTYSVTLAQGSGSANATPLYTTKAAAPAPARHRFNWFHSLLNDPVAVPALYALLTPLFIPVTRTHDVRALWLYVALPATLAFVLGLCRTKKRSGLLSGALLGFAGCMAILITSLFQSYDRPNSTITGTLICMFVFGGGFIGLASTTLRQFLVWLFGNKP